MLSVIEFGTCVSFAIVDDYAGLNKKSLLLLRQFARSIDCYFRLDENDIRFNICNLDKLFSKDFIITIVNKVKEIAVIELDFEIEVIKHERAFKYSLNDFMSNYVD